MSATLPYGALLSVISHNGRVMSEREILFTPVILCGGSGTRLWPLSRTGFPKQFLVLNGRNSLFQQAYERLRSIETEAFRADKTLVITNEAHRFLVTDQLRELDALAHVDILLESQGRNTAPAITLSALQALQNGNDPVLVVSPADQIVTDLAACNDALRLAVSSAAQGHLVVLGITPTSPETGYGYIQHEKSEIVKEEVQVIAFAEKPDLETARRYLESGEYSWNSGMFVVRASVWLQAMDRFAPDILQSVSQAWEKRKHDGLFLRPDATDFASTRSESADYAVLENCPGSDIPIRMVALEAGWSDLGAWDAVWQVNEHDDQGNAFAGDAVCVDTRNTLVHASHRLVSTVGVDDLVVVETSDAVLVARRDKAQNVKAIVQQLISSKRQEHELHRKVYRPWGWYDSIDESDRFKVKRIMVKPGASLSLQMHHHRAEHWIVVKGTAAVTCGDKTILLSENQSTYIPLGKRHMLANPGTIPLEIIEVQSGSYLGEDDIVRFEDHYGRK